MSSIQTHVNDNKVITVTLNRPEKHNAFDSYIIAELTNIFKHASQSNYRALVLSSTGKSFSAGADLQWMKQMVNYNHTENLADANALALMLKTLNTLPMPTIARVQGAVFGGAVGLVSCCDMAIASDDARFCLSEVKIGLIPATISPYVIAAIGQRASRRYFLSAEVFSAETASDLGLIASVVTNDELDAEIERWITQVLQNSPAAITLAKELIFDVDNAPLNDELIADTSQRIAAIRVSTEGQEGLNAFLEKRPAKW
ncbi:MAG: enoyl-CoA hydratase/isomerase family protein [Arenicella sp.]